MAITKILARKGRLDVGINYVLNGDKTQERVLTAHLNCRPQAGQADRHGSPFQSLPSLPLKSS